MTTKHGAVEGTKVDPAKVAIIASTIRSDLENKAPMYSHLVSDEMVNGLAADIAVALAKAEGAKTI